ncbi:MAG: translesion error-prone DNA polymerase V autoproteolytic subunit [Parachlamydiales bacterium]|nr:translesion error-prone DNA polymerase V autoproteolytic subunit [Parachlamydiales bacterium]
MGRGGKRMGAGRPRGTGKFGEPTKPIRIPISDLEKALRCIQNRFFKLPLYHCPVKAGIPESVEAEVEKEVDLNEILVKNAANTFLVKVNGSSMIDAGIQEGDLLIVDRSIEPVNQKIVIASLNGELTVKRLRLEKSKIRLIAENKTLKPIEISEEMNFQILGTVTGVIHLF